MGGRGFDCAYLKTSSRIFSIFYYNLVIIFFTSSFSFSSLFPCFHLFHFEFLLLSRDFHPLFWLQTWIRHFWRLQRFIYFIYCILHCILLRLCSQFLCYSLLFFCYSLAYSWLDLLSLSASLGLLLLLKLLSLDFQLFISNFDKLFLKEFQSLELYLRRLLGLAVNAWQSMMILDDAWWCLMTLDAKHHPCVQQASLMGSTSIIHGINNYHPWDQQASSIYKAVRGCVSNHPL